MRERTTWNKGQETPRAAATQRRADIYTMNQEHPQPSPVDYENGDPDSWAETPADSKSVDMEYENGRVKRNEIGLGEMRADTFKHKDSDQWNGPGKYDNARQAAERKATAATKIASALLRTSNASMVEEMALDLMALPDRSIVSTLKRLQASSPDALAPASKQRRAYACVKLASRMLASSATEVSTESLARTLMRVDDPTLKSILQQVAAASRVAAPEDNEEQGSEEDKTAHTSQQEKEQDQGKQQAQAPKEVLQDQGQQAQGMKTQESEEQCADDEQATECELTPEEMAMLDGIAAPPAMPGVPGMAPAVLEVAPAAPMVEDLSALFDPAQAVASDGPEISFDDEDEPAQQHATAAAPGMSLDDLFNDDPEVQAQREIVAANQEQFRRELGYGSEAIRTASQKSGAKKLGAVRAAPKSSAAETLENIWIR